ncbi:uncharacterized protein SCODWIG_00126 [Saccharomycodes ludwigii]|uniref:E3 ubiquitin-protein ligase listerin n=1 Tax=Saccharomycodes ludwigii TaxID=36035 RepID=A0A376B107_9ASCO|nr:uncharacterized protein SCODWIG_00126 [Saccharomycodes ludwigii]
MSFQNPFLQYTNDFGLGNNGVKITLNYFDGIPDQSLIGSLTSNDIILCFKSLLKRDDTTKEKALLDLKKIISDNGDNNSNPDVHSDITLLLWTQIYAKLIVCDSKNIRVLSHEITCIFINCWNKKISKFLKDLIPILLSGVYDPENIVSKNCIQFINFTFKHDLKKIQMLWKLFMPQICKFIHEIVVSESQNTLSDEKYMSKDESMTRYNRLTVCAICMGSHLLKNFPDESLENEQFMECIESGILWDFIKKSRLESAGAKIIQYLFTFISILYSNTKYFKQPNISNSNNAKVFKTISKKIFKLMGSISKGDAVLITPIINDLMNLLIIFTDGGEIEKQMFWDVDKTSKDRLVSFLSIGCANSSAFYYKQLYKLCNKNVEILGIEGWNRIWNDDLKLELERKGYGKLINDYFIQFWNNYLKFVEQHGGTTNCLVTPNILQTLKQRNISNNKELTKEFLNYISFPAIIKEITHIEESMAGNEEEKFKDFTVYLKNLMSIACNDNNYDALLKNIFADNKNKFLLTKIAEIVLDNSQEIGSDTQGTILDFTSVLISELSAQNFELISNFVAKISNSKLFPREDVTSIVHEYLTMVMGTSTIDKEVVFPQILMLNNEILLLQKQTLMPLIDELIEKASSLENMKQVFELGLINESQLIRLYNNNADSQKNFFDLCRYLSSDLYISLILKTNFVFKAFEIEAFSIIDDISPLVKGNNEVAEKVVSTITQYVSWFFDDETAAIFSPILRKIFVLNDVCTKSFLDFDYHKKINTFLPKLDYNLSLTSSLGVRIHLLQKDIEEACWQGERLVKIHELLNYSIFFDRFLTSFPEYIKFEHVYYLTIIKEILEDYNSISGKNHLVVMLTEKDTFEDQTVENSLYKRNACDFDFVTAIKILMDSTIGDNATPLYAKLFDQKCSTVLQYYNSKILCKLLTNAADCVSFSQFSTIFLDLDKFVGKIIRGKDTDDYSFLQLSSLFISLRKFYSIDILGKIRNMLAAELIESRTKEIINSSYKILILLTCLLSVEEPEEDRGTVATFPIQAQRLNMVLGSINKWMDNEEWYMDTFACIRICLLQFFNKLVVFGSNASSLKMMEIVSRLLNDALTLCKLHDTPYVYELRQYVVGIMYTILKHQDHLAIEYTDEFSEDDLLTNLTDLCFISLPKHIDNQIDVNFFRGLNKVLTTFPITSIWPLEKNKPEIVQERYEKFVEFFQDPGFMDPSLIRINQVRIVCNLFQFYIRETQNINILDFELEKKENVESDGDDDNSNGDKYTIPEFITNILREWDVYRYVDGYEEILSKTVYTWVCLLLSDYFITSSYNLRQLYIGQSKDLLFKVFNFISEECCYDFNVNPEEVSSYKLDDYFDNMNIVDISHECKHAMVHTLFELFGNVGSVTSNWWLNLEDKTFKLDIEKFVSSQISSILIKRELECVTNEWTSPKRNNNKSDGEHRLSIKTYPKLAEIKATYLIDEQKLEIAFKFPKNYPLLPVQVQGISRVGVSEQKWKLWIVSTQRVITAMNGSIIDSLDLFSKNVELQFSGFEECAVCYSILHPIDRKLPSKTCPTCHNRFHSACLYKWFKTSNNNQCPLCRGEFNFKR